MKLRKQNTWSPITAVCGTLALGSGFAHSALVVSLTEAEGGAIIEVNGSLDLSGLLANDPEILNGGASLAFSSEFLLIGSGLVTPFVAHQSPATLIVDDFGDIELLGEETGIDGGLYGFDDSNIFLPDDFVSGETMVSELGFISGNIFTSQGGTVPLNMSSVITLPSGDTFSFVTNSSAIPEPSSILSLGVLLGSGFLRRKR